MPEFAHITGICTSISTASNGISVIARVEGLRAAGHDLHLVAGLRQHDRRQLAVDRAVVGDAAPRSFAAGLAERGR
ncbi:MAG: hypothetical protein R3D25_02785 [Geminicoccaceae bacterium]